MGNYRFRLLDMIPNAWFYKPKPKPKTQNNTKKPKPQQQKQQQQQQSFVQHRNSYYFTSNEPFKPSSKDRLYNSPTNPNFSDVHFLEPPPLQKSSKTRPRRRPTRPNSSKLVTTSSVSAGCRCRASIESSAKTDSTPDSSSSPNTQFNSEPVSSWSSSSSCKLTSSATDIIIDVEKNIYKFDGIAGLDSISEIELPPPILTKPAQIKNIKKRSPLLDQRSSATTKIVNEENVKKQNQFQCASKTSPRIYSISPRVKLRANSPKIRANRKPEAATTNIYSDTTTLKTLRRRKKKQVSESFAIMKSSFDPQKDFRDSMVEMIVENNLRASKDLEELLACYLSLNSNEYHGLIVKVFEQIWFDLIEI